MQNTIKETVTQRTNSGVATVAQESSTDTQTQTIANIIYFVVGLVEIVLVFRFLFKITGANPASGFVYWIYNVSQLMIMPFSGIFSSAVTPGVEVRAVFEPATLIALLVYGLLAWGLVRLVAIVAGHSSEEL